MIANTDRNKNDGFVLIALLFMLAVLLSLVGAYFVTTDIELAITRHSKDSVSGFYAAEGGLNIRAEEIRQTFIGFNRPSGTTPALSPLPCADANQGSGDFICKYITLGKQDVQTYLTEEPSNPISLTIPPGELYQSLNAQEYRYTVNSEARNIRDELEANLQLRFKSRLVPLFQFAAFYDKDLEILPGATMTLEGPVHTNGDLYLNTEVSLDIKGQVTVAGGLTRGRKNENKCDSKPVRIPKSGIQTALVASCSSRKDVSKQDVVPWLGMIQIGVEKVTVPGPEIFDPTPGALYWDKADLRLVLKLDNSNNPDTSNSVTAVEVRNPDNSLDLTKTQNLNTCSGSISGRPVGTSNTLYNNRENKFIRILEVDLRALLDCIHTKQLFGSSKGLDDSSEGGIVVHFTVSGPNSLAATNTYGTRISNANPIKSTISGAPLVKGISIISDQAMYIKGDFNKDKKIPAAIMVDSFNVLSGNWNDANSKLGLGNRVPSETTINSALLSGTDTTGGIEGHGGRNGHYNGGLENYPRLHEKWSNKTFTYNGSFVSLGTPRHVSGEWVYGGACYEAPNRDWHYDTMFNDAANLPPITPRFVYLRQELFVRDYD